MNNLQILIFSVFFSWLIMDTVFITFRNKSSSDENKDRFSKLIITSSIIFSLVIGIYIANTRFGSMGSMLYFQIIGFCIMLSGMALRMIAIRQLGQFHTPNVAILNNHQLINTGLYRYIRHPSYTGALITFFGFGFALANWLSLMLITCISIVAYLYRIHEEEKALRSYFGEQYDAYRQQTKRLIPKIY